MKKLFAFVLITIFVISYGSTVFAWTDDVEGMLMPSPRGEDNVSNPEAIMENIEPTAEKPSDATAPTIEWE